MKSIRIGNDISFVWRFYTKNGCARLPYVIQDKNIKVIIADSFGTTIEPSFTKQDNEVHFSFLGKDQRIIGEYTLTLFENAGGLGMKAIDKITPFRLVSKQERAIIDNGEQVCPTLDIVVLDLDSDLGQFVDYNELQNKPKINRVALQGNKTLAELGIASAEGLAGEVERAIERENELEEKIESVTHPYISLERVDPYLFKVTFDGLPEDNGSEGQVGGGCSSYVQNGKLHTNLDWDYDNTASFIVKTRDFEGQSFIKGLNDGEMDDTLIAQLPYRVHRGVNNYGIKVASHILYNDWDWTTAGEGNISLTRLPFLVLTKVKSMATLASDLDGVLDNLYCSEGLAAMGYLLQLIVTDGTTTYAIIPPTSEGESYEVLDITSCPKLTNFRPVGRAEVSRTDADIQAHPTGIERYNMMPCLLKDLRFTKAYEATTRLSEFIGLRGTTKDSTDAELEAIYADARAEYLQRERDGKTWQTMESAVYGDRLEALYIQEDWSRNLISATTEYVGKVASELADAIALEIQTAREAEDHLQRTKSDVDHNHNLVDLADVEMLSQEQMLTILNS